ncbi:MAG: hypothetical protein HRU09_01920 [Oligoflexales bacterium]|nr:hypothetical protein [Oligoflexales bacterium]
MFLVKFGECLNQMIKCLQIPLLFGIILLSHQSAYADLTDDLEDLDPKSSKESPGGESNGPPTSKPGTSKKNRAPQAQEQGTIELEKGREQAEDNKAPQPDLEEPKKRKRKAKPGGTPQTQGDEKKLPVIFEGDQLSGIKRLGTIELHQNVKVNQGDFNLEAENAKVFFDTNSDEVDKVIAKGSVKMSKVDPQTGELIRAYSQIAEFDAINQKVELIDKAKLIRGEDVIRGEVIVYDLKTGRLKASKVKGVVKPQETQEAEPEKD